MKRGRERRRERSVRGVTGGSLHAQRMGIVMDQLQPLECVLFFLFVSPSYIPGEPLSLRVAAAAAVAAAVNLLWAILAGNRQPEEDQVRSKEKESENESEREGGGGVCVSKRGGKNGYGRRVGRREKLRSIAVERRKEHEERLG